MCRKHSILIFAVLITIPFIGCGLENVVPSMELPPLDGYSKVLLVPFNMVDGSAKYTENLPINDLPVMVSYGIGNKLEVRYTERSWIYDKSNDMSPVRQKLNEIKLSAGDVYQDTAAAVKLAEAFEADLVIVGQMKKPEFIIEETGKMKYVMDEMTPTGTARYYTVNQKALLVSDLKIVDVKAGKEIWYGRVTGYTKYETDYRTGSPRKLQRESKMLSDVRKDLVDKVVEKIFPEKNEAGG